MMRGSESLTAARPYTGPDQPPSQAPVPPVGYNNNNNRRRDRAKSGGGVDIAALSGQAVLKHKRVASTPKSDAYGANRRFIQYDVLKDGKPDDFNRARKSKTAKPKSEKITDEMKTSQYICVTSYSKLPKRWKTSRKENSERVSSENGSKGGGDRPWLDRRSRTFIVDSRSGLVDPYSHSGSVDSRSDPADSHSQSGPADSHSRSGPADSHSQSGPVDPHSYSGPTDSHSGPVDSRNLESLHRKIKSRHEAQSHLHASNKPQRLPESTERQPLTHLSKRTDTPPKEVTSSVESQSEERREAEDRRLHQWEAGREGGREGAREEEGREGARNPVTEGTLPVRPKSAGQLRYCDADGSDESSLDGEIEIVDIDKELEDHPEPSPYWSQARPLQVPEVFLPANPSANSPPRPSTDSGRPTSLHTAPPTPHHHHHLLSTSPHLPRAPGQGKQRHGSGESDLSVFSDTGLKPPPPHERRRFLSEPEILSVAERSKSNGRSRKGGRLSEDARVDLHDVTFPSTSSVGRRGRQWLYSDGVEHVTSRYSQLGLRDVPEDGSSKGRPYRLPVGHHVPITSGHVHVTSGHVPNASVHVSNASSGHAPNRTGSREGASSHLVPPRKLKPILKHGRHDYDTGSSS